MLSDYGRRLRSHYAHRVYSGLSAPCNVSDCWRQSLTLYFVYLHYASSHEASASHRYVLDGGTGLHTSSKELEAMSAEGHLMLELAASDAKKRGQKPDGVKEVT